MERNRPIVLSIAGFDPSGGAGVLADIKTFEQHGVYGLGINTAQTLQTEDDFFSIRWEDEKHVLQSVETLLSNYDVKAVKIGIVENINRLKTLVSFIHKKKAAIKIVADTVIKTTSGFNLWDENTNEAFLFEALSKIFLITPNYNEALQLLPSSDAKEAAEKMSVHCRVLLKGGHNSQEAGVDYLFTKNRIVKLEPSAAKVSPKHGSGCVLSAAITANLALGYNLETSCIKAKKYIEHFLSSNNTLLGFHHV